MTGRSKQLRAWLYALTRFELTLRAQAARARNAYLKSAAAAFEDTGTVPNRVIVAHRLRIAAILDTHYRAVIPHFAAQALKQVKSRRFERKETLFDALVQEWVTRESLRKATLIADTDRDDVLAEIGSGLSDGLGTAEIARNIRKVSQLTPYRAATVARTEAHAAATYGSIESVRAAERELGVVMLKVWLPTLDDRTRPDHAAMASYSPIPMNERFTVGGVSMDRPGDPSAPPEQIINCLHPSMVIHSGQVKVMTRHWYEGGLVNVKTESGNALLVTPNHPVLTRRGWVAASLLKEGDGVIGSSRREGALLGDLDVKNVVATAEQIFDSLAVLGASVRVGRAYVNFHGEWPDGDIDVVHAARKLRNPLVAALGKPLKHFRLACTDFAKGRLLAESLFLGVRLVKLRRSVANRLVSLLRQTAALFPASVCHPRVHTLASGAGSKSMVGQAEIDGLALHIESVGQSLDRLTRQKANRHLIGDRIASGLPADSVGLGNRPQLHPGSIEPGIDGRRGDAVTESNGGNTRTGQVFIDEVVGISHMPYSGYVFNLETSNGYYICNGVVQHNCRCAMAYQEQE